MAGFIISYVPNVENVDNIELLKKVNSVDDVTTIQTVKTVNTVKNVENVENVDWVETVDEVNTVHDVRKLPHPYFPLKKYNFQPGGMIHVTPTTNTFQAVFVPPYEIEFNGVHLAATAYNIEDTYDVMIGARYIMQDSHVKEMSEYRMLNVYEVVPAGTPIVINFHNNSGLEKHLMYEFILLANEQNMYNQNTMNWVFNWEDMAQEIGEQDTMTLMINQPNYVNMDSNISTFSLDIMDLNIQQRVATVTCSSSGTVTSDYNETEPSYQGLGFLARANAIAIVSVTRFAKAIQVVFKNINNTGTLDPHPVEIGIEGNVVNIVN